MRKILFLIFAVSLTLFSCQNKNLVEMPQLVAQPEVEINKNFEFSITFPDKPEKIWVKNNQIAGLELLEDFNKTLNRTSETTLTDEKGKEITTYTSEGIAKPTKLGKIEFPAIYYTIKGKQFETKPLTVNSVEKINVDDSAIILKLSSNKEIYSQNDEVKISLYQYSKFYQASRFSKREMQFQGNNLDMKGEGNSIKISFEKNLDDITGILGFEELAGNHFKPLAFDYDPFYKDKAIENIGGINYIKSKVFDVTLKPKKKGKFAIGPAEFVYFITKSFTDYLGNMEDTDEAGVHRITKKNSYEMNFKSNPITFTIE